MLYNLIIVLIIATVSVNVTVYHLSFYVCSIFKMVLEMLKINNSVNMSELSEDLKACLPTKENKCMGFYIKK